MLRAKALYWRAQAVGAVGWHSKARRLCADAAELLTKLGDPEGHLRCWFLMAELYFAEGLKDEALEAVQKVLQLARSCGDLEVEYEASLFEAEVSRKPAPSPEPQAQPDVAPAETPQPTKTEVVMAPEPPKTLDPQQVQKQLLRLVKAVMGCASFRASAFEESISNQGLPSIFFPIILVQAVLVASSSNLTWPLKSLSSGTCRCHSPL